MNIFHGRQGQMETSLCYFYTDTIHEFKHLLSDDEFSSLQRLPSHFSAIVSQRAKSRAGDIACYRAEFFALVGVAKK